MLLVLSCVGTAVVHGEMQSCHYDGREHWRICAGGVWVAFWEGLLEAAKACFGKDQIVTIAALLEQGGSLSVNDMLCAFGVTSLGRELPRGLSQAQSVFY